MFLGIDLAATAEQDDNERDELVSVRAELLTRDGYLADNRVGDFPVEKGMIFIYILNFFYVTLTC